jgi:hypothetical protein
MRYAHLFKRLPFHTKAMRGVERLSRALRTQTHFSVAKPASFA